MMPAAGSGGADEADGRYAPIAEINVTPMVDVMLVLLVIFMVAAPLLTVGVPVDLPRSSAAAVTRPRQPIILSVNRAGELFLGDSSVPDSELRDRLARMARDDADRIVYVRGDRTVAYGRLMALLGIVSRAGFDKVSLLATADGG